MGGAEGQGATRRGHSAHGGGGFGGAGGFNFLLQDRSGTLTVEDLGRQTQAFLTEARQRPELANLFTSFNPTTPQVSVQLDREKARELACRSMMYSRHCRRSWAV